MFQWIFCIRQSSGSKKLHSDVENSASVTKDKGEQIFHCCLLEDAQENGQLIQESKCHGWSEVGTEYHHTLELAKIFPSSSSWGCTWLYSLSTCSQRGRSAKVDENFRKF
jgi:hypothetical protein